MMYLLLFIVAVVVGLVWIRAYMGELDADSVFVGVICAGLFTLFCLIAPRGML